MLHVLWGNADSIGEGKGNDRDDDAIKENVCEDGQTYGEEDEPM